MLFIRNETKEYRALLRTGIFVISWLWFTYFFVLHRLNDGHGVFFRNCQNILRKNMSKQWNDVCEQVENPNNFLLKCYSILQITNVTVFFSFDCNIDRWHYENCSLFTKDMNFVINTKEEIDCISRYQVIEKAQS